MPLMATFDPSGASRQLPFRRGAMRVAAYRTFSQTGTQGRAGTPAPTTRVGRVRNICVPTSVSSHTICCEVVIVIPTFPVVPRKGRRGRRPLRWVVDVGFRVHVKRFPVRGKSTDHSVLCKVYKFAPSKTALKRLCACAKVTKLRRTLVR